MKYAKQNAAVLNDKNQFFAKLRNEKTVDSKIGLADQLAADKEYIFLLKNQNSIETEFTHIFTILKNNRDKNNEAFWMYCYYTASLLEAFYKAYSPEGEGKEHAKLKEQIKNHLLKIKQQKKDEEESFIQYLENCFLQSLRNLKDSRRHTTALRDYVAYSNLCRVYWVFCRLTLVTGFSLADNLHLFDKLDAVLGTHTDVNKIIQTLQAPNGILNYFSVGLFLARFVIDGALLLRHTFFPSDAEKQAKTTAFERFKYEMNKRHCNFVNDLVWAMVNFMTNFNHITHISGAAAGAITAVFLGFDMCMFLYKLHLVRQEYLAKKEQYAQELAYYSNTSKLLADERILHVSMLQKQLNELEISWQTKQATFCYLTGAAALLAVGFSAAMLFTPPGIALASFFMGTFAVSLYLSTGTFSKFIEKGLRLDDADLLGVDKQLALNEYQAARNDFIFTLIKNTVMPTLLIATFAVYWPAAIVLTAAYIGYELYHSYGQHSSAQEAKELALESPKLEPEEERYSFAI